jgi:hypothetical protein
MGRIMIWTDISVKKYVARLSSAEREQLETLLWKGKSPARRAAEGADIAEGRCRGRRPRIVGALDTSTSMVYRVRRQLVEKGLEAVLSRK